MTKFSSFATDWLLPPSLLQLLTNHQRAVKWSGNYDSWDDAQKVASGYDNNAILDKVLSATQKVIAGEAAFERDSVLFAQREFIWPVITTLLWVAAQKKNRLDIIDFGGALGSLYFQHKDLLSSLNKVCWNVVEQPHFVDTAKKHLAIQELCFFSSIQEAKKKSASYLLLLSGVLPYLPNPHAFLHHAVQENFEYILINKTSFLNGDTKTDRLTLQTVQEPIYNASYPCWFFAKKPFMQHFEKKYELLFEFDNDASTMNGATYQGMLFKRKAD